MKYELYTQIEISEQFETYDFISSGIKGNVEKRVKFQLVETNDIYNLAFGDIDENNEIDDYSITDNKDMPKVLATIAFIARVFLEKYPQRTIIFRGSTAERTRLYRMAIGNNLDELITLFDIFGVQENGVADLFIRNKDYYAFLVKKNPNFVI